MVSKGVVDNADIIEAFKALKASSGPSVQTDPPSVHPFPARLPLQLTRYLMGQLCRQGAVVVDPMVGSGTVAIAARQAGFASYGFDRDPLALLISRVSTRAARTQDLQDVSARVLENAMRRLQKASKNQLGLDEAFSKEDRKFVRYWFPLAAQRQLYALALSIGELDSRSDSDFAWLIFSKLIVAKSAGASYAMDIARSRPHKRTDKPIVLPFDGWEARVKTTIRRLPFLDVTGSALPRVSIKSGDARSLPLPSDGVDLVFTSPPYGMALDYMRGHKFSLLWMGHTLEKMRALRSSLIGTERGLYERDGLPSHFEKRLVNTLQVERKRAHARRYLQDVRLLLAEMHRVLKPNGVAVLIVGPRFISRTRRDASEVVGGLAEANGFEVVEAVERKLLASRRSLPFGRHVDQASLRLRMDREVFVAVRKRA